jgi:hypothetical protein
MENRERPATLRNMMMKSTASFHERTSTADMYFTVNNEIKTKLAPNTGVFRQMRNQIMQGKCKFLEGLGD